MITRLLFIALFFFSILFSAGWSQVHVGKVYSQEESDQNLNVCTPEEQSTNVCTPEEQSTNVCTPEEQSAASCGANLADDVLEQRCVLLILEKYRYLLSSMEHLTPVFQTTNGAYCNPLAENCNVRNYPNFFGCTILITNDTTVCSKRSTGQPITGRIDTPPHWLEPPIYEKLFPAAKKDWAPCSLDELSLFWQEGKRAGHYFGMGIELLSHPPAGAIVLTTSETAGSEVLPTPVGIITKYTGGAIGGAVGGIYCGIGKVEKAWEKLKYELTDEHENRLLKFKLATEKWCDKYDNQKDVDCLSLIDQYYQCMSKKPPGVNPVNIYFVEGAIAQGKDPCLWKR